MSLTRHELDRDRRLTRELQRIADALERIAAALEREER